jgi:opacity protein-like surface antigen
MKTPFATRLLVAAALVAVSATAALAQSNAQTSAAGSEASAKAAFDKALSDEGNWYFSWGYSRQQYAPSDIHVSQPTLGNDFTVHQAAAGDFPSSPSDTIKSLFELDFTNPQENVRVGKFLNADKTFAVEFSLDHSKYNTNLGQTAQVTGTVAGAPVNSNQVLDSQYFNYALHNGLNHLMVNAVWLHHLAGPEHKAGDLQLISRAGAGILLPHADNTIQGNQNQVGPKNQNICCFASNDWWQVNGWTAGVEVGVRYRVYKSIFLELTQKIAYGALHGVPVYQGTADQTIWMSEQVLSAGFLF